MEKVGPKNATLSLAKIVEYVLKDCCNCVIKEGVIDEIKDSKLYKNIEGKNKNCNVINIANGQVFLEIMGKDRYKKQDLINKAIYTFRQVGLLKKRGNYGYYLLNTSKRLAWNNIKYLTLGDISSLNDNVCQEIMGIFSDEKLIREENPQIVKYKSETSIRDEKGSDMVKSESERDISSKIQLKKNSNLLLYIKCLFWYFRKAVVDSVLSDIINSRKQNVPENITAMSVGSTKIASDYDITIDASYETSAYIIENFDKLIRNIFKYDSEKTFDTNVYGVSFIKNINIPSTTSLSRTRSAALNTKILEKITTGMKLNTMIDTALSRKNIKGDCGDASFKYIDPNENDRLFNVSQNIWAYVKLLLKMNMIQHMDDKLYDSFYKDLHDAFVNNIYYQAALEFINKYDMTKYSLVVDKIDEYITNNIENKNMNDKYLISNFISFVNYNGSETYVTNGAFIDVVVNSQMCKSEVVKLGLTGYFNSFIENMSELISHYHRNKYLDRAKLAFNNILKHHTNFDKNKMTYINNTLNNISNIQSRCSKDIVHCQSFLIMFYCISCIIMVSNIYIEYTTKIYNAEEERECVKIFNEIQFPS